jgi:glycerol kinase
LNLHTLDWDDELLEILGIPRAMLPEIGPSSGVIAETDPQWRPFMRRLQVLEIQLGRSGGALFTFGRGAATSPAATG